MQRRGPVPNNRSSLFVGIAIVGAAMILFTLLLRIGTLRAIARRGRSVESPWRFVLRNNFMLFACVVLITIGVNRIAGEIALAIAMVVLIVVVVRGLWRAPRTFRRGWRYLGDPEAWRGHPGPDS